MPSVAMSVGALIITQCSSGQCRECKNVPGIWKLSVTSGDKLMFYDFFGDFQLPRIGLCCFPPEFSLFYLCSTCVLLVFTCVHFCSLVLMCVHLCSTCVLLVFYLCSLVFYLRLFVFICVPTCVVF